MNWDLYDIDGEFLKEVNCEYDSLDISRWEFNAVEVRVDFKNKKTYIIAKGDGNDKFQMGEKFRRN